MIGCNLNPQPLLAAGRDPLALVAAHVEAFCQLRKRLGTPFSLVVIPHDRRAEHRELEMAMAFYRALPAELRANSLFLGEPLSAAEIKAITASLDFAVTGRMHFAIAVLGNGRPAACVSYHPKFEGLLTHFGQAAEVLDWQEAIVPEKLTAWLSSFTSRRVELTATVVAELPKVLKLARANLEHAEPVTNGPERVNGFHTTQIAPVRSHGNSGHKPRILGETTPASWGDSNGGWRRTVQLHQIVTGAGIELQFAKAPQRTSALRDYCKGLRFMLQTGFAKGCCARLIREHGAAATRLEPAFEQHAGAKVFIWEVTRRPNQAVPWLARQAGFSVVALPHNLEALAAGVPASRCGKPDKHFAQEARALSSANAVFTISSEEQWLLALHGLKPEFLPYFPPENLADRFLNIRERRREKNPHRLLVLGTVWNPPTLHGMSELIDMLRNLPGGPLLPVDIAGFGTEQLQPVLAQTAFRLHGGVSEEKLDDLLLSARAVVVYQRAASGALTRLSEMLLAGIPVIANSVAARSHSHLDGIHVFDTPSHLYELLTNRLPEPAIPARPVRQEKRLVAILQELLAGRT